MGRRVDRRTRWLLALSFLLVCVALAAIVMAIVDPGGDDQPAQASAPAPAKPPPPKPPEPRPAPPPQPPPKPEPEKDDKGYPEGTKDEFVDTCEDEAGLGRDQCGCVYDRLHDKYDYEEFEDLIERIDPEKREVPSEILDQVLRCRLPGG